MKTHMVGEFGYRNLCTGKISGGHFTRDWGEVTCKLCLRKIPRHTPEKLDRLIDMVRKANLPDTKQEEFAWQDYILRGK